MLKKILQLVVGKSKFFTMFVRSVLWKFILNESASGLKGMVRVNGRITISHPENLYLGKCITINEGVFIVAQARINIGDGVRISPGVIITSTGLDTKIIGPRPHLAAEINVGDNVWLGSGAILLPGVNIGENSIIAAGSVVNKDVPSNVLVAGVPATVKKYLDVQTQ